MWSLRARTLAGAALCLLAPSISAQTTSPKRGLVYVDTASASSEVNLWTSGDLTWYYNYLATPTAALAKSGLQFVPMLWGATIGNTDMTFYNSVKSQIQSGANITYVLGFNEPDGCFNGGSCVDAQTAAETWIRQMEPLRTEFGVKLGAPAVTGAQTGFNWLRNFFTQCAGRCHADFIPIHWYGDFQGFASHVGQVNATYQNMTMWVTEFALANSSLSATQSYYNETIPFLDRVPYITHYSYFGAFRSSVSNVGPNAAFLTGKGLLTDIGAWYLGEKATGNIPTTGAATTVSTPLIAAATLALLATLFGMA